MPDLTVNENSAVYYRGRYWNDLPEVRGRINKKISGDPGCEPDAHFARRHPRGFRHALVLNCGNGWVERDFFRQHSIDRATGVDFSEELLEEARKAASDLSLPVEYVQMDTNTASFPARTYDLVINWAAGHHIAYLDKVLRELCRILPNNGWMLSFDYVGPHRNQYTAEAWEVMHQTNAQLPGKVQQKLLYPHLPTMLDQDPTEAIHSELVLSVFRRYFDFDEYVPLGGAIAYPLLTFNDNMFDLDDAERRYWVEWVLDEDDRFLAAHPESSLFAYFTGTPRKAVLEDSTALSRWSREEEEREASGAANGGEYYQRTALQTVYVEVERLERSNEQLRQANGHLQALNAALERRDDAVAVPSLRATLEQMRRLFRVELGKLRRYSRR